MISPDVHVTESEKPHTAPGAGLVQSPVIVTDEIAFFELRGAWNALVEKSGQTPYQTHEWASCWWRIFGKKPNQQLCCLVMNAGDRIIGIAPFYRQEISLAGIHGQTRMGFIGEGRAYHTSFGMFFDDGPSDYLDILVDPEFEQPVCDQIAEYLSARIEGGIAIHLVSVPEQSVVRRILVRKLQDRGVIVRADQADVCPFLSLPVSLNGYISSLNASVRRRMTQALRAGTDEGMFALSESTTPTEFHHALDSIIDLHQRRWNKMGFPGLFADDRFTAFQHAIVDSFSANGWLWCRSASTESGTIASRLAFRFGDTLYDYLSGFDDAAPAAKRRPGLALLLAMISAGIDGKFRRVDFLRGDESYKFELTSSSRYNWNYTFERDRRNRLPTPQAGILWLGFAKFLVDREARLIGVQYRQNGLLGCIPGYIRFRTPRFRRKLRGLFRRNGDNTAAVQREHE